MSTRREVRDGEEPPLLVRIGWSILVGIIGIVLLALGGEKPIQTAIIAGGCPLFVNIMVTLSFIKDAKTELERLINPQNIKRLKDGF
ncbi:BCCT family transporter [Escherichia coli]